MCSRIRPGPWLGRVAPLPLAEVERALQLIAAQDTSPGRMDTVPASGVRATMCPMRSGCRRALLLADDGGLAWPASKRPFCVAAMLWRGAVGGGGWLLRTPESSPNMQDTSCLRLICGAVAASTARRRCRRRRGPATTTDRADAQKDDADGSRNGD